MPWLEKIVAEEPTLPLPPRAGYPLAALLVGVALGGRIALGPALVGVPFITLFPAVLISAVLGGFGPGLVATGLGALAVAFGMRQANWGPGDWEQTSAVAYTLFIANSALFCLIVHGFYTAVARLRQARLRERELLATLEQRIAERTEQLSAANERLRHEMAEREKAEAAVRQSQKMEVIGRLTGGVAHDFNNLLTVILGNIEAAQLRLQRGEAKPEASLAAAQRGAERAASLTHRLLAFARQQPLDVMPVDLNRLIAGMSELIRRTLGSHIAIETVLAGGLWRTRCDANQLEAALLNLVVNARDAMEAGGKLTIETANAHLDDAYAEQHEHDEVAAGQYVMIAVTDTGTGMSPDVLSRAFEPFFTTKPIGEGTGLGLSMVFGFIKQLGGHIKIYSEPEYGTTVKIYLPRLLADDAAEPAKAPAAARPEPGGQDCMVLVVEDDPDVRAYVVECIADLGYRVCEAPDGPTASEILKSEPDIAVLFTDVGLPNTDLRALVEEAKRLHRDVRVIYTTGYTRNAIVHGGILDPAANLLSKPFTSAALARKLREVLQSPLPQTDSD